MIRMASRILVTLVVAAWAQAASAQTVDEVISRTITALGGRASLEKLKSRSAAGSITLATPGGDIAGSVELYNVAPNKSRSVIKADLSQFGAGQLVIDQRFNGTTGYVLDSLQGNRDMAGDQLNNLRNASFPHPFLNYKELGTTAKLTGKETVGTRNAHIVSLEPTAGPVVNIYVDAETYMPIKTSVKLHVAQLNQDVEQTTELTDWREQDGVKIPFELRASSSVQNYTIKLTKIEHNVKVDEAMFSKPQ